MATVYNKTIELIKKTLEDGKGKDITIIDVKKITPFADYYIIATAGNPRHLNALKNEVLEQLELAKKEVGHCEGSPESGWVLIDAKSIIINLFTENVRKKYELEKLLINSRR
jgi:ribosome-associated protein